MKEWCCSRVIIFGCRLGCEHVSLFYHFRVSCLEMPYSSSQGSQGSVCHTSEGSLVHDTNKDRWRGCWNAKCVTSIHFPLFIQFFFVAWLCLSSPSNNLHSRNKLTGQAEPEQCLLFLYVLCTFCWSMWWLCLKLSRSFLQVSYFLDVFGCLCFLYLSQCSTQHWDCPHPLLNGVSSKTGQCKPLKCPCFLLGRVAPFVICQDANIYRVFFF